MHDTRMQGRMIIVASAIAASVIFLIWKLMTVNLNSNFYLSFDMASPRQVTVVTSYGDIYDRNGISLVNGDEYYLGVINPETADRAVLEEHITDREKYEECIDGNAVFLCETDCRDIENVSTIPVKIRYSGNTAAHIIGYTSDGHGVCGIEADFDDILRTPQSSVTLSYSADAQGRLIKGGGLSMR